MVNQIEGEKGNDPNLPLFTIYHPPISPSAEPSGDDVHRMGRSESVGRITTSRPRKRVACCEWLSVSCHQRSPLRPPPCQ